MASNPYHTWQEDTFRLDILRDGATPPETLEVGDAIVTLPDGTRYSALMMTPAEIARIMTRHETSGESLSGSYFCAADLIIIKTPGVPTMIDVIRDLADSGDLPLLLPRIPDNGPLELPSG